MSFHFLSFLSFLFVRFFLDRALVASFFIYTKNTDFLIEKMGFVWKKHIVNIEIFFYLIALICWKSLDFRKDKTRFIDFGTPENPIACVTFAINFQIVFPTMDLKLSHFFLTFTFWNMYLHSSHAMRIYSSSDPWFWTWFPKKNNHRRFWAGPVCQAHQSSSKSGRALQKLDLQTAPPPPKEVPCPPPCPTPSVSPPLPEPPLLGILVLWGGVSPSACV